MFCSQFKSSSNQFEHTVLTKRKQKAAHDVVVENLEAKSPMEIVVYKPIQVQVPRKVCRRESAAQTLQCYLDLTDSILAEVHYDTNCSLTYINCEDSIFEALFNAEHPPAPEDLAAASILLQVALEGSPEMAVYALQVIPMEANQPLSLDTYSELRPILCHLFVALLCQVSLQRQLNSLKRYMPAGVPQFSAIEKHFQQAAMSWYQSLSTIGVSPLSAVGPAVYLGMAEECYIGCANGREMAWWHGFAVHCVEHARFFGSLYEIDSLKAGPSRVSVLFMPEVWEELGMHL